jgi:dTDP-4-dehydrorhamnose reductase
MNIAVLGGSGFIGQHIVNNLSSHHNVFSVNRSTIDLIDGVAVKQWLKKHKFDVIINCATIGKKNNVIDEHSLLHAQNNLNLFMNFYSCHDHFNKFINIGSGAEFDLTRDINVELEEKIHGVFPSDSYGWSKNIISRMCSNKNNFFTIRLFGCFASDEPRYRLFPRLLEASNTNTVISINSDRYFDYVSVQDFLLVLNHFIANDVEDRDINCVYEEKKLLSEIIFKFCEYHNIDFNLVKIDSNMGLNYTGSSDKIKKLKLNLNGLYQGIADYGK